MLFFFLFLLSFFFVTMILELLGLKKHAFWRFFTQMTANFVRLVFKKSARICIYLITPYQVKIWQGILLLCSFVLHNLRSTPQMKWPNGSQDYNSSDNTLIIIQCCFHRFYRVAKADLKFFNRNLLTCLHEVTSWFHLFSVARWGLQVINTSPTDKNYTVWKSVCRLHLAPGVKKVENAIHWINLYPVSNSTVFPNHYPLDSDLSGG